jgi:hypothetical protein
MTCALTGHPVYKVGFLYFGGLIIFTSSIIALPLKT